MKNGGNVDNLVKSDDLTSDELRERAQKGGLASVAKRQEDKEHREYFDVIAGYIHDAVKRKDALIPEEVRLFYLNAGIAASDRLLDMAIDLQQVLKALEKDTAAATYWAKIRGRFKENVNVEFGEDMTIERWYKIIMARKKERLANDHKGTLAK